MNDMFVDAPIPIAAQIACVERELNMRRRVYPRWVSEARISQAKANDEIKSMEAVRDTLRGVQRSQDDGK